MTSPVVRKVFSHTMNVGRKPELVEEILIGCSKTWFPLYAGCFSELSVIWCAAAKRGGCRYVTLRRLTLMHLPISILSEIRYAIVSGQISNSDVPASGNRSPALHSANYVPIKTLISRSAVSSSIKHRRNAADFARRSNRHRLDHRHAEQYRTGGKHIWRAGVYLADQD